MLLYFMPYFPFRRMNVSVLAITCNSYTGKPAAIEEERRLLYVAMTRAKRDLHLIAPLKYYVTQQSRTGDTHVYGARSRFLTDAVMQMMDSTTWPAASSNRPQPKIPDAQVDVRAQLRAMWD